VKQSATYKVSVSSINEGAKILKPNENTTLPFGIIGEHYINSGDTVVIIDVIKKEKTEQE